MRVLPSLRGPRAARLASTAPLRPAARAILLLAVALLAACAPRTAPPAVPAPDSLLAAYRAAIRETAVFRPEQVRPLRGVPADADSVRVVTWTRYPASFAGADTVRLRWGDVWVTLQPEVRDVCRHYPPESLVIRLEQLLGLPPRREERTFVVLDVAVADLFRPCPDPDPSAPACGPDFPDGVDPAHVEWLARQMLASYRLPDGYPWTRLGYTYNWAPGRTGYGASEYVVRGGALVRVVDRRSTTDYCGG